MFRHSCIYQISKILIYSPTCRVRYNFMSPHRGFWRFLRTMNLSGGSRLSKSQSFSRYVSLASVRVSNLYLSSFFLYRQWLKIIVFIRNSAVRVSDNYLPLMFTSCLNLFLCLYPTRNFFWLTTPCEYVDLFIISYWMSRIK